MENIEVSFSFLINLHSECNRLALALIDTKVRETLEELWILPLVNGP